MKPLTRNKAVPLVQIDNDGMIVTKWSFEPDDETGLHKHAFDYLVIPLSDGSLLIEDSTTVTTRELRLGESYVGSAGVEYNVVNQSQTPLSFIEVEWKKSLANNIKTTLVDIVHLKNDGENS